MRKLKKVLIYALVGLAIYFGNVEFQTMLGRRAVAKADIVTVSLTEAMQMSAQEGKPVLADLSALWCPSCRKLDNEIFSQPIVKAELQKNFIFTRVDYESEEGKAFRKRYGTAGIPNLLVLNEKGQLLRKLPLVFDPELFVQELQKTLN